MRGVFASPVGSGNTNVLEGRVAGLGFNLR